MEVTINTDSKVITFSGLLPISDLMDRVKSMFPNDEWKEYKIGSNQSYTIGGGNWSISPIIETYPFSTSLEFTTATSCSFCNRDTENKH